MLDPLLNDNYILYMIRTKNSERYEINFSKKVFVYKNLHKDCWSVRQNGLVKAHAKEIRLWDCSFQVNQKGRNRVLEEKSKNVHAGIKGFIDKVCLLDLENGSNVTYNPYKYETFVIQESQEPIFYSNFVELSESGVVAL